MISRHYGAHPLHLLGHIVAFGLFGYAMLQVFDELDKAVDVVIWLVGAILLHDAILWPIYSGADTLGRRLLGSGINYVRIPLGLSLVLALVFISTLLGKGARTYQNASGLAWTGYVERWFFVSFGLVIVSAAILLVRERPRS